MKQVHDHVGHVESDNESLTSNDSTIAVSETSHECIFVLRFSVHKQMRHLEAMLPLAPSLRLLHVCLQNMGSVSQVEARLSTQPFQTGFKV